MRTLYHFPTSPFSRRVRLALAHKGLEVVLKDARADEALLEEARRLWPLQQTPVLVEDDGLVLGDSPAILHYLDEAYPQGGRLWPKSRVERHAALEIMALVDASITMLVDVGSRYYPCHNDPAWREVQDKILGRVQGGLNALGERAAARGPQPLTPMGWSGADIVLYTAVAWFEGLPARASTRQDVAQIVSLPWSLPASLSRWADAFRARDDVRALG